MRVARLNNLAEIFYSLQGEGATIGTPAIFLRLFGCNLSCEWCDTPYSWKKPSQPVDLTINQIKSKIMGIDCKRLVITGGEPLIQQKELFSLLKTLESYTVEIETNGTIAPDEELDNFISQYNISPKLKHANNARLIREDILTHFAEEKTNKSWFKFVVNSEKDIDEVKTIAQKCRIKASRIILMPQAGTRKELEEKRLYIANLSIKNGYRFSDRLHITLWGDKKGV